MPRKVERGDPRCHARAAACLHFRSSRHGPSPTELGTSPQQRFFPPSSPLLRVVEAPRTVFPSPCEAVLMRVCLEPGCARLSDSTRCEYHRKAKAKAADKRRPNANQRGYGAHWRKVRKQFLRDNPNCIDCGGKATVPDHAPLSRVQIVAQGVADPDAPAFLQPRCHTCHMRRTVLEDGGFGRERKEYR